MTTGGLNAADQLCTANINMGVSGGPVMAIQSRRFVGVVFSLDRMYSQDQGQARFYVTTQHSDQWQVIQDHIDHDRRTVTDRAS
ncbi:hypothetical protein GN244_ATG07105 [Phytophthora infestans]|nr:hypothetical protein GN244_ATG07105 [Phytophthora infestans]